MEMKQKTYFIIQQAYGAHRQTIQLKGTDMRTLTSSEMMDVQGAGLGIDIINSITGFVANVATKAALAPIAIAEGTTAELAVSGAAIAVEVGLGAAIAPFAIGVAAVAVGAAVTYEVGKLLTSWLGDW